MHRISLGLFSSFILSLGSLMDSTVMLSNELAALHQKDLEIEKYRAFLRLPDHEEGKENVKADTWHIEVKNVSFTYPSTEKKVLDRISFSLDSGVSVALVGENGAGKSTLVKLLVGLFQPDSGEILVNGISLQKLDDETKRNLFSVIFQDYMKYSLTLRENIALGNLKYINDDTKIQKAIQEGMAADILKMSPKGLDMNLGKLEDDGLDLSGGQWQRVALARALIGDAAFVILDEPSAAMDPHAESRLYQTFHRIMKKRGSIMVSHRLASARMADKIIVLQNGKIREMGTHEKLMENRGLYYDMYQKQSAWYQGGTEKKGEG